MIKRRDSKKSYKQHKITNNIFSQYYQKLKDNYRYASYVSFLAIGILSLFSGNVGVLSLIALVPLCVYLKHSNDRTKGQFMLDFYLGGVVSGAIFYSFFMQAIREAWGLNISHIIATTTLSAAVFLNSTMGALAVLGVGYILFRIDYKKRILALIILWPIMERVISVIFSITNAGHSSSLAPYFNFGSLAVDASGTPLVYLARFFGFYGLTVTVVTVNILIYKLIQIDIKHKETAFIVFIFITVGMLDLVAWQKGRISNAHSKIINVAVVHLNANDYVFNKGSYPSLYGGTDLLVLPEWSGLEESPDFRTITNKLSEHGAAVTSDWWKTGTHYNSLVYYNKNGDTISRQPKTFIIPGGEYIPYVLRAFLLTARKQELLSKYDKSSQVIRGTIPEKTVDLGGGVKVGALVCSGVLKIGKYRGLVNEGANILVNTASLSFLVPGSVFHAHGRNMARFQAVMNNRPFVQASRSGESYILDNQGNIIAKSYGQKSQLIQAQILINP